jgi:tripartite-type tricarboxylate transporter receptor subunit TctC
VNRPGGGGLVGEDFLYTAKPDGLTLGEVNGGGSVFDQIVDKPGVNFDMTKFGWIGSPNIETPLTAARSDSEYKSFADLWNLRGGAKKVVALSAGYGGTDYIGVVLPLETFGIPYRVLLAYQGSSAAKAGLLRGDGDIANYGYSVSWRRRALCRCS